MFSDIVKEDIKSLQVDLSSLRSAIAGGLMCSADLIKDLKSKLNFQHIFVTNLLKLIYFLQLNTTDFGYGLV